MRTYVEKLNSYNKESNSISSSNTLFNIHEQIVKRNSYNKESI